MTKGRTASRVRVLMRSRESNPIAAHSRNMIRRTDRRAGTERSFPWASLFTWLIPAAKRLPDWYNSSTLVQMLPLFCGASGDLAARILGHDSFLWTRCVSGMGYGDENEGADFLRHVDWG